MVGTKGLATEGSNRHLKAKEILEGNRITGVHWEQKIWKMQLDSHEDVANGKDVTFLKEKGTNNLLSLLPLLRPTGAFHWMNPNQNQPAKVSGGCSMQSSLSWTLSKAEKCEDSRRNERKRSLPCNYRDPRIISAPGRPHMDYVH